MPPAIALGDAAANIVTFLLLGICLSVYFLPSIVAWRQESPNTAAVLLVNLFAWTGIGWIIALRWARSTRVMVQPDGPRDTAPTARCASCGTASLPTAKFCATCGRLLAG